jgi:hypothetical protein
MLKRSVTLKLFVRKSVGQDTRSLASLVLVVDATIPSIDL